MKQRMVQPTFADIYRANGAQCIKDHYGHLDTFTAASGQASGRSFITFDFENYSVTQNYQIFYETSNTWGGL